MRDYIQICLILLTCYILIGCKNNEQIETIDDTFPMELFSSYLPWQIGDTILYDLYMPWGKDLYYKETTPFVVTNIINIYDEGNKDSYSKEYAEYGVELFALSKLRDSLCVNVNFVCTGRTRIHVQYDSHDCRLYDGRYIRRIGEFNYANPSNLLFEQFPKDSIVLENDATRVSSGIDAGILKRNVGLEYFVDALGFIWKISQ